MRVKSTKELAGETINSLVSIPSAKTFNAGIILRYLSTCDRANARGILRLLQGKLENIISQQLNTFPKNTVEGAAEELFTEIPRWWWTNGTPEQKLLALFSLKELSRIIIDARTLGTAKEDIVTLQQLTPLLPLVRSQYKPLESSFLLILETLKHMADIKCVEFVPILKSRPIIINLGGLFFDSGERATIVLEKLDLTHANLPRFRFRDIHVNHCKFKGSNLDDCRFPASWVSYCDMSEVTMKENDRQKHDFSLWTHVNFSHAIVENIDFTSRNDLSLFDFSTTTFINCNFEGCTMPSKLFRLLHCNLNRAIINDADFTDGDLEGSTFIDTHFKSIFGITKFSNTNLTGVDLSKARFSLCVRSKLVIEKCRLLRATLPASEQCRREVQIQLIHSPQSIDELNELIADIERATTYSLPTYLIEAARETLITIIKKTKNVDDLISILKQLEVVRSVPLDTTVHEAACKQLLDLAAPKCYILIGVKNQNFLTEFFNQFSKHQLKRFESYLFSNKILFCNKENNTHKRLKTEPFHGECVEKDKRVPISWLSDAYSNLK